MSAAVPSTGLGHQLKIATATMHRRVERTAFMAGLLRGQVDRRRYAGLLHNLQALYAALEDALTRHAATPGVAPVVMPELFRGRALAADLQALAGDRRHGPTHRWRAPPGSTSSACTNSVRPSPACWSRMPMCATWAT